jgi:GTP1/Obg family GTP-binding protein
MTLTEVEQARDAIKNLATTLMETPTRENARVLIATSKSYRSHMTGRFGNVREQFTRLMEAAKKFDRATVDITEGQYALERALSSIDIAISVHKQVTQ